MTAPASGWFRGLAAQEPTPGRTAFVQFRAGLVRRGLDRPLFEAVTRQLDARTSPPPMSTTRPGWMSSYPTHPGTRIAGALAWAASRPPRTIHNGLDFNKPTFQPRAGEHLLFFGRIHPDKGAADAVRMARAAGRPSHPCRHRAGPGLFQVRGRTVAFGRHLLCTRLWQGAQASFAARQHASVRSNSLTSAWWKAYLATYHAFMLGQWGPAVPVRSGA